MSKPYAPSVTFEQLLAYDPNDSATHTASPIVNAVAEILCENHLLECAAIARHMRLDPRKLTAAVQVETGMLFTELVRQYRIAKIREYIAAHPNATLEEVAKANGYVSNRSMWRLFKDRFNETARGTLVTTKSNRKL